MRARVRDATGSGALSGELGAALERTDRDEIWRGARLDRAIQYVTLATMAAAPSSFAIETPAIIERIAAGQPVRLAWQNELGGLTFEVTGAGERCFVKWSPASSAIDLRCEVARLTWAARYTTVPRVLGHGADSAGSWLVTAALPGESAVAERWKRSPATAVAAIGRGLRALHDRLPVGACPFSWSAEGRLEVVRARALAGRLAPACWHPAHRGLTVPQALDLGFR